MPARSLVETVEHYAALRKKLYELVEREYAHLGVSLREISIADAREGDSWVAEWGPGRAPTWSWLRMFNDYRSASGAKRFDVAVRVGGRLCGLCYGIPNKSRLVLRIHAVARAPTHNPLERSFFSLCLFAAATYASFIGSEEIALVNPVNEAIVEFYCRFGFSPVRDASGRTTHMTMRIT
jgi:hypothetical protein